MKGVIGGGLAGVPVVRFSKVGGASITSLGGTGGAEIGGRIGGALLDLNTSVSLEGGGDLENVVSSFRATFRVDFSVLVVVVGGACTASRIAGVADGFGGTDEGINLVALGKMSLCRLVITGRGEGINGAEGGTGAGSLYADFGVEAPIDGFFLALPS